MKDNRFNNSSRPTDLGRPEIDNATGYSHCRWHLFALFVVALLSGMITPSTLQASNLISEDFSGGASNFTEVSGGTWSVSSGRYTLTSPGSTGAAQGLLGNISVHQTVLSGDYTVSGTIQLTGTGSTYDDGALIFDYQDASNYYYVCLTETNKTTALGLMRILNGSHSELQDFSSLSISSGVDYLVEVERSGSSIIVYVDSVQVASVTDSTFSGGKVGFGSQNDPCQFDDLVVPNSILIEEDFASSASNFTEVAGGTWSVSTGRYRLTSPSTTGAAQGRLANMSVHQTVLSGDYTVSGTIQLTGTGSTYDDGALIFDYQDATNYYYVCLTETNKTTALGLMRILNNTHSELQDFSSLSISSGVDYSVEVVRSGSSITVYVDSVQVASVTDSTFSGGKVGFGSQNDPCEFDDLTVVSGNGSGGGGGSPSVYYVDPSTGSMSNPGTSAQPWSTLEAVFSGGKTFQDGDTILLRNGHHGYPTVTGNHSVDVTIMPDTGHAPTLRKILFDDASHWILSDMEISPETVSSYEGGNFIQINADCSDITVEYCDIYSASSTSGWTRTDWKTKTGSAFFCYAPDCLFYGNTITNISIGILLASTAVGSEASANSIDYFRTDAIRSLGDYQIIDGNIVTNAIEADEPGVDGNHEDAFQSYSSGSGGSGSGTVTGTIVRNNVFINFTDPNFPDIGDMQGIGMFDGYFEDWVIENNLVVVDHFHGISVYGGINCRIINNTVLENPDNFMAGSPWLNFFPHKTRTPGGSGNIVRNNIAYNIGSQSGGGVVSLTNNLEIGSNYSAHFVDYDNYDFHLKSTSSAIDAGSTTLAPATDLEGDTRDSSPDIGSDEYIP